MTVRPGSAVPSARRLLAGLGALGLAIVLYFVVEGEFPQQMGSAQHVTRADATRAALPPADTPVKEVVARLKAAADAGEPASACRLGVELTRCHRLDALLAFRDTIVRRDAEAAKRGEAAALTRESVPDIALCDGITAADTRDAWKYLLRAAQKGNMAATRQFLVAPPLAVPAAGESLDGWTAYRDLGAPLFARAIEGGDVQVLYLALFAAAYGMGPVANVVERNPYRAVVYVHALLPLVDPRTRENFQVMILPTLEARLDPASVARATAEGNALRARHFAGTTQRVEGGNVGEIQPARCAD